MPEEIGHGASVQALWERGAREEWADARSATLLVQGVRSELHGHAPTGQTTGPESGCCSAVCERPVDEPHRPAAWRLNPHHPGLAGAIRPGLRPEARARRPGRGDRAG